MSYNDIATQNYVDEEKLAEERNLISQKKIKEGKLAIETPNPHFGKRKGMGEGGMRPGTKFEGFSQNFLRYLRYAF